MPPHKSHLVQYKTNVAQNMIFIILFHELRITEWGAFRTKITKKENLTYEYHHHTNLYSFGLKRHRMTCFIHE